MWYGDKDSNYEVLVKSLIQAANWQQSNGINDRFERNAKIFSCNIESIFDLS